MTSLTLVAPTVRMKAGLGISGTYSPTYETSLLVKMFWATETKRAPPRVCKKMMSDMPVGTSAMPSTVCTAISGCWNPVPTPAPMIIWYPIHAPALVSGWNMVVSPNPTAVSMLPTIMKGV